MAKKKISKQVKKFEKSSELTSSQWNAIFNKQNLKNDFRDRDLRKYRNEVLELYKKGDTFKRLNKALQSKNLRVEDITDDKIDLRGRRYGKSGNQFRIEFDSRLDKFILTARNGKGQIEASKEFEKPNIKVTKKNLEKVNKLNFKKQEDVLRDKIKKKGFKYEKVYVPEDTEPERKLDRRQNVVTHYTTFYRIGVMIYRMKDGKKYELIYQLSNVQSPRNVYLSFQKVIAEVKEDILNRTGLSLEEWIHIAKTRKDIFVEGGIRFKRFKEKRFLKSGKFVQTVDYDREVNFERL